MAPPSAAAPDLRCGPPLGRGHVVAQDTGARRLTHPASVGIRCAGRLDAIIVPASRGAAALDGAAHLSARLGVPLVALCSKDTRAVEAAARLARIRGCHALVIDVPSAYRHDWMPTRTAAPRFRVASAHRRSDLSLKRNLGLLMARLYGWGKILFLDDDIGDSVHGTPLGLPTPIVRRLAAELDVSQIAGLTCSDFPDQLRGVSRATAGRFPAGHLRVRGGARRELQRPARAVLPRSVQRRLVLLLAARWHERSLGLVGTATQAPYDPFADPRRAREEEFGDLLAEGLYTLFEHQAPRDQLLRAAGRGRRAVLGAIHRGSPGDAGPDEAEPGDRHRLRPRRRQMRSRPGLPGRRTRAAEPVVAPASAPTMSPRGRTTCASGNGPPNAYAPSEPRAK